MFKRLTPVVSTIALLIASVANAQTLTVELNKLENVDAGCQAYFLFQNGLAQNLEGFEMSLAILSPEGIIDRLLTIDAAPLPAQRTTLKLFEIPDTACGQIGEVLLHDIPVCKPQNGEELDCFSFLELNSRADAPLVK